MKISFLIPAVVLYVVRVAFSNFVPVGTVLFTTTDLVRKCWTESDKALLKARLIMQDVLPDPDCIDFSKPEAAVILLDYFHACYQIISTSTYGKVQNLMYLALSDALGGYLRAYVLPFTRRAYYAGQMEYSEAKKLFQLYDDIRLFLKTSGLGWAEPQKVCYRKFRVKPLIITGGSLEACNQLYTIESDGKLHWVNSGNKCTFRTDDVPFHFCKNCKESLREDSQVPKPPSRLCNSAVPSCRHASHRHRPFPNATLTYSGCSHQSLQLSPTKSTQHAVRDGDRTDKRKSRSDSIFHRKCAPIDAKRVIIPLPVLDDCGSPRSIAVPFRKRPLRNLSLRNSAFILEYYYIAVIKCFVAKGNTRTDIKNFNAQFHSWLVSQVFPRLSDEQWYPAFGGVLRVMQTIRKFGGETTVKDPVMHDIAYMFGKGVEFDITESPRLTGRDKVRDVADVEDCYTSPKRHYLTAMLLVSLIWIFIFCTCAFYCQATRGRNLLYEGCSKVSSYSQGRRVVAEDKDKFINFQFLVKFFKKRDLSFSEEPVHYCFIENEKEKKAFQGSTTHDTKPNHTFQNSCQYKQQQKVSQEGKVKEKGRLVVLGQGDIPAFPVRTDEIQHQLLTRLPLRRYEKTGLRETQREWEGQAEQGQNYVEMLWRKPSIKFKRNTALKDGEKPKRRYQWTRRGTTTTTRTNDEFTNTTATSCSASMEDETKGSSTEKRSSTCCCSESYQHSNMTSNSSSQTQVDDKLSSSTKQFFQKIPARHKPCRSSTQETTAESESVGDESCSSESDY